MKPEKTPGKQYSRTWFAMVRPNTHFQAHKSYSSKTPTDRILVHAHTPRNWCGTIQTLATKLLQADARWKNIGKLSSVTAASGWLSRLCIAEAGMQMKMNKKYNTARPHCKSHRVSTLQSGRLCDHQLQLRWVTQLCIHNGMEVCSHHKPRSMLPSSAPATRSGIKTANWNE